MTQNSTISFPRATVGKMNAIQILAAAGTLDAIELFKPGNVGEILEQIENEVKSLVFDVSTLKGRKEIASMAYKISRSKTTLDDLGKGLVAGWKEEAAVVDRERKLLRDRLDVLRNQVRDPLTRWEEEKKAKEEKKNLAKEIAVLYEHAVLEDAIFDRDKAGRERMEKKEKRERIEKKKKRAEEAAREAARIEYEEIRKDAEQRIIDADLRRVRELKEQEERIRREQEAKEEAEKMEKERIAEVARRAAQDIENRRKVNTEILYAFIQHGIGESTAKEVVRLVASGRIPRMSILY